MVHRTRPESGSPITQLEQSTMTAMDEVFARARRAADRNPTDPLAITRRNAEVLARIRELNAPVIDLVVGSARQAVNLGVDDAVEEAPPPDTPEGRATAAAAHFNPHADDSTVDRLTADVQASTSNEVRRLTRTAGAVASGDTRGQLNVVTDLNRTANQLVRTRLIDAYNRGRRWYAGLFQFELQWVTVSDNRVCPICQPLDGVTIASQRAFTSERATFQGVPGQPPAHPLCRCYTQVVRPS